VTNTFIIDLLRHGEPEGGVRFRGSSDDPLTELGWSQMQAAIERDTREGEDAWQHIISSPLQRCLHFSQKIAGERAIPLSCHAGLQEMHFGDWEGKTMEELLAQDAEALSRFWQDPFKHTPPNAETLEAFQARVIADWGEVVNALQGHTLLVVHKGVISVILRHVLGMPESHLLAIEMPFASRTRLQVMKDPEHQSIKLISHGGQL
jgi:alpha-ribazole phosphatase